VVHPSLLDASPGLDALIYGLDVSPEALDASPDLWMHKKF
jgi:hypothetical protein